jgi:predicted enzyme related to lactoylglutathione lyase
VCRDDAWAAGQQPAAAARSAQSPSRSQDLAAAAHLVTMKRVIGVGGIFLKSADPGRLREWYRRHLGLDIEPWGGMAFTGPGTTVWNVFESSSNYFAPSQAPFMVNYRVERLHPLLAVLRAEGCQVDDKVDDSEYGKFGWVIDPDGNKIELWEPPEGQ